MRRGPRILLFTIPVCLLLVYLASPASGVQYFYDDLNRVVRVLHEDGTAVLYRYDEVGNRVSEVIGPDTAPPNNPSSPSIPDGATGVSVNPSMSWTGGDPYGDAVTYDLYLDTNSDPTTLIASWQPGSNFNAQNLSCGTTYYWKIVATDQYGATTQGPVWHFTTEAGSLVKNTRTGAGYSTLQDAYNAASHGDTILTQNVQLRENFTANRNITVTVDGGYDCGFISNPNTTTILGATAINSGTVYLKNFKLMN